MSEVKPYLFMDVDGVINLQPVAFTVDGELQFNHRTVFEGAYGQYETVTVKGPFDRNYRVCYAPELIDWLKNVIIDGKVNFFWVTSWRESTSVLNELFGFPQEKAPMIPWTNTSFSYTNPEIGKLWGISDYLGKISEQNISLETVPFVWVDDVATIDFVTKNEVAETLIEGHPVLAVRPDPKTGLLQEHIRKIEQFLG